MSTLTYSHSYFSLSDFKLYFIEMKGYRRKRVKLSKNIKDRLLTGQVHAHSFSCCVRKAFCVTMSEEEPDCPSVVRRASLSSTAMFEGKT